ncbi:hypothetical protein FJZ31_31040 [Candidatus Poribacteria bacterium]|nr:hypothetical protein [Candidatus Poribacteria bacterium]
MRTVLIIILLFAITLPCFAELTQQDLEKISNLIDRKLEPIKLDVAEMKGKMATKDDLLNMWKDIDGKIDVLYGVTIGILIAIIATILSITLPSVLQRWFERRKQTRDEDRLRKIEAELEKLKIIREVAKKLAEEKPELAEAYRMVGLL